MRACRRRDGVLVVAELNPLEISRRERNIDATYPRWECHVVCQGASQQKLSNARQTNTTTPNGPTSTVYNSGPRHCEI